MSPRPRGRSGITPGFGGGIQPPPHPGGPGGPPYGAPPYGAPPPGTPPPHPASCATAAPLSVVVAVYRSGHRSGPDPGADPGRRHRPLRAGRPGSGQSLCTDVRNDAYTRTHGIRAAGRGHRGGGGRDDGHEVQRGLHPAVAFTHHRRRLSAGLLAARADTQDTVHGHRVCHLGRDRHGRGRHHRHPVHGESGNPVKVAGIALVIAGVVVLNLGGTH